MFNTSSPIPNILVLLVGKYNPTSRDFLGGNIMYTEPNLDAGPCGGNTLIPPKVPSSWGKFLQWKHCLCLLYSVFFYSVFFCFFRTEKAALLSPDDEVQKSDISSSSQGLVEKEALGPMLLEVDSRTRTHTHTYCHCSDFYL